MNSSELPDPGLLNEEAAARVADRQVTFKRAQTGLVKSGVKEFSEGSAVDDACDCVGPPPHDAVAHAPKPADGVRVHRCIRAALRAASIGDKLLSDFVAGAEIERREDRQRSVDFPNLQ